MKILSVLGSTGSIGTNTLKLIAEFPEDFRVAGLCAGKNAELLAKQTEMVCPEIVSSGDKKTASELQALLRQRGYLMAKTRFLYGVDGHIEAACHPESDIVLSAISGAAGLLPTYRALESGKSIALANKETMVMAGELMMRTAAAKQLPILPVDSEHNAIHQCLRGGRKDEVKRIILTASGGPFRKAARKRFESITPAEALAHPTWNMGRKITIDSATLMNKGLEVIEAARLFGFSANAISVVIHPQSVVHSMVEFLDGSMLAQLGVTDMRLPIQYALTYPERWTTPIERLDIYKLPMLEFFEPDMEKFPCLGLAYNALAAGGTAPAVLNAANEIAVDAFLNERLAFTEIPKIVEAVLQAHKPESADNLDVILRADDWARKEAGVLACDTTARS